jgi:hypothetical protein
MDGGVERIGTVRTRDGEMLPVVARGIENGQPDAVVIGTHVFDLSDGEHDLLDVYRACVERGWVPVRTSDP